MMPNKELAKRVILEILHQNGGAIGKTKLFKTFWLAHLYYFKKARGYLTDWPIIHMPNGPGIDKADSLLEELTNSGFVTRNHEERGPFVESNCCLTDKFPEDNLSAAAVDAIREAVTYAKEHTAESISDLSHDFSRSWRNTQDGAELDIYNDLLPDDLYEENRQDLLAMKKLYEELFP